MNNTLPQTVSVQNAVPSPAIKPLNLGTLSLLALVVGLVTGIGAAVFRALIGFIHNLFFLGSFSAHYDANHFTPAGHWARWSSWCRS